MVSLIDLFFHPRNFFSRINKESNLKKAIYFLIGLLLFLGIINFAMIHFLVRYFPTSPTGINFEFITDLSTSKSILFFFTSILDNSFSSLTYLAIILGFVFVVTRQYHVVISLKNIFIITSYSCSAAVLSAIISDVYILMNTFSDGFSLFSSSHPDLLNLLFFGAFFYTFFLIKEGIDDYLKKK